MPLLRITYQRGALNQAQKAKLAAEVTPVLLIGEVGSDTPQGRAATNGCDQKIRRHLLAA